MQDNNIKEKLEKEKQQLKKSLGDVATKDPKAKHDYDAKFKNFGDPIFDNTAEAAEVSLYDSNLSVEGNLELKLKDVNEALDRIKEGTFGKCENCNKEIDKARLEANPTAKLCIDCAKINKK
ncbi:MAG: TraR/DksA family transcriptional regulator [Patescibacteria group bacterium]|nr:TraR/DksA family transcriptional regulator [Patescibacteria group bacterium]